MEELQGGICSLGLDNSAFIYQYGAENRS